MNTAKSMQKLMAKATIAQFKKDLDRMLDALPISAQGTVANIRPAFENDLATIVEGYVDLIAEHDELLRKFANLAALVRVELNPPQIPAF